MKLLFNLEVVEGNRIHTHPGEQLNSQAHDNQDLQARAESVIGIASTQAFLEKLPPVIFTGNRGEKSDD